MAVDSYNEIKECVYKDEHYSVRADGAIMRHQREGMRKRKLDDVWSFGTPNAATGYMDFCGERVHRIVATAFLGPAPSEQHVVDHFDTNRQNNRPENLRWLTKLENILNNEITRKKVELICGSIEAFLENPSLLYGYETEDKNFSWMRNVTKEEAKNCLENWNKWVRSISSNPNYRNKGNHIGDWIYNTPKNNQTIAAKNYFDNVDTRQLESDTHEFDSKDAANSAIIDTNEWLSRTFADYKQEEPKEEDDDWFESLTPLAKQSWWTETEFPCCPTEITEDGLERYKENLREGNVFSKNTYTTYYVVESKVVSEKNMLAILCTNNEESVYGAYSLVIVKIEKGAFCHISLKRYGHKTTALHFYKLIIGEEEWTENDEIMWDT
jgi:hypothetical protein